MGPVANYCISDEPNIVHLIRAQLGSYINSITCTQIVSLKFIIIYIYTYIRDHRLIPHSHKLS